MGAAETTPIEPCEEGVPRPLGSHARALPAPTQTELAGLRRARARLSGHLGWNLGADILARGASLWLSYFCARTLDVGGFGRFSFALAIAQYAWLIGDAALNGGYATRETARLREGERPIHLFWTVRLLAATVVTALYLTACALAPGDPATRRAIAAAATFFLAYAAFPDWALRAIEDFRGLALANAVYAVTLVLATLVFLPAHPDPGLAAMLWGSSFAIAAVVSLLRLARGGRWVPRLRFSARAWWPHARRSWWFSTGSIAAIGYTQLPILMSGVMLDPHEVGLFSAGFRMLLAGIGALTIVWWPVMPALVREPPDSPQFRDVLGHSASLVLSLSAPVALAVALFATEVLTGVFGSAYVAGARALAIGAWVLPLYALTGLLEQTSLALGGERLRATVAWTTLAAMTGMSVTLMPRFGATGAALTSVAGFALALVLYAWRLRTRIHLADVFRPAWRVAAASMALLAFWLVAPQLVSLPLGIRLGAGAALYLALARGLGLLRLAPGFDRPGPPR